MVTLEKDITTYYETKPIIIFCEKVNTEKVEVLLKKR
jgi:hypothetical protein